MSARVSAGGGVADGVNVALRLGDVAAEAVVLGGARSLELWLHATPIRAMLAAMRSVAPLLTADH